MDWIQIKNLIEFLYIDALMGLLFIDSFVYRLIIFGFGIISFFYIGYLENQQLITGIYNNMKNGDTPNKVITSFFGGSKNVSTRNPSTIRKNK